MERSTGSPLSRRRALLVSLLGGASLVASAAMAGTGIPWIPGTAPAPRPYPGARFLTPAERQALDALVARLIPAGLYRAALAAPDAHCRDAFDGRAFAGLAEAEQDALIERMEEGEFDLGDVPVAAFFALVHDNTIEGFFSDPIYGGNRDMAGWRLVGFPGVRYDYRDYLDHDGAPIALDPVGLMGRPAWNVD